MIFSREQPLDGHQLIEAIESSGKKNEAASSLLKDQLLPQIRHMLQFFYSTSEDTQLDQLLLAGECASLPGLADLVQEHTGIQTEIANPLPFLKISSHVDKEHLEKIAPALMVACGLAMHRGTDS